MLVVAVVCFVVPRPVRRVVLLEASVILAHDYSLLEQPSGPSNDAVTDRPRCRYLCTSIGSIGSIRAFSCTSSTGGVGT